MPICSGSVCTGPAGGRASRARVVRLPRDGAKHRGAGAGRDGGLHGKLRFMRRRIFRFLRHDIPHELEHRFPPPSPETCLVTSRVSRFKGGTLIDEDVRDLEACQKGVSAIFDGYWPDRCPRCGHGVLHVHCYPERRPRGEPGMPAVVRIIQYLCAAAECGATWRILPMFLARHLWRVWPTVERVVMLT